MKSPLLPCIQPACPGRGADTRFLGGGVVTARQDLCYELVGVAGYFGEGSLTGCLLSMGTQGNSALHFFLRRKCLLESVGCRCFVSLIRRGQLEFCQHE